MAARETLTVVSLPPSQLLTAQKAGELLELAARFEAALRRIATDADSATLGEQLLGRIAFEALKSASKGSSLT